MLSEALKYLTTPCAPHLKSMGYLRELIALGARARRCQAAWAPHLAATKETIIDAINSTQQREKAVVLGAGILSDIPLKTLSDSFRSVELIDICFLRQTRKAVRPYSNLTLHTYDITGIARALYDWTRTDLDTAPLPGPGLPDIQELANADLVISANVVSQLPLIPLDVLRKHKPDVEETVVTAFARKMIESHIALLRSLSATVCLVTETKREYCDGDQVLETEDPLFGYLLNAVGKEWEWDLAPPDEVSADYAIRNHVIGLHWTKSDEQ